MWIGSTVFARTVALLAVDALEISRRKAGRSGCVARPEECATSWTVGSSVRPREAAEAFVLGVGEGLEEAGVERGIGEE